MRRHAPPPLELVPPWKGHRFPHRRITRRVVRARDRYRCEIQTRPPVGHVDWIEPGTHYLRVHIRPDPGRRVWGRVRLCPACAEHVGLAIRTG